MSLFVFGSNADSWAIAGPAYTAHKKLPASYSQLFENGTITGMNIEWGQTGPDGLCYFQCLGQTYRSQNSAFVADLEPPGYSIGSLTVSSYLSVDFVSFSTQGGWFIRYSNGQVKLSAGEKFPESFHRLAGKYMVTKGATVRSPQYTALEYVWFGANDSVLIQTTNGSIEWEGIPPLLSRTIHAKVKEGWLLNKNTTLCQYDQKYFFVGWISLILGGSCSWSLAPSEGLTDDFIRDIVGGKVPKVPVSHTVSPPLIQSNPGQTQQAMSTHITCDQCHKRVIGVYYWHCGICSGGDFDICQSCGGETPVCPGIHTMIKRSIQNDLDIPDTYQIPDLSTLSLSPNPGQPSNLRNPSSSSLHPGGSNLTPSRPSSSRSNRSYGGKEESEEGQKLRDALEGAIVSETPNVHWDDVAGLDQAKEELQEAVILPIKFPQLFTGTRKARRGMLLYGPPGTGKSYLAKAVATEVDCPLFSISSSDIMSKWLGESEKLVKTLFEMARERKPAIIFIDEIEAIAGSREAASAGGDQLTHRAKTELLVQMDGVGKDNTGVLVLAATNLPWMLDSAIRRRFQRRIHIGLPDFQARRRMFEIGVGQTNCTLTDADYNRLAQVSEGFSGSDISIVVQDALMQPVKKIHTAKYYRKVMHEGKEKLTPCTDRDRGAMAMTWRQVPADKLLEPNVLAVDFYTVITKVKPSVSAEDIRKAKEWTEEYGLEGA